MAETIVACPKCSTKLKLKGDVSGKAVKCPKCATAFRIGAKSAGTGTGTSPTGASSVKPKPASAVPSSQASKAPSPQVKIEARATKAKAASRPVSQSSAKPKKSVSSASASAPASPKRKKKKRAPKPPVEEVYDDVAYDDVDYDDYGDDYGFDDGYADTGGKSLPSPKKKKKSSGKKGKNSKKSSQGSLQDSIQALGFVGWILCGSAAGLVGIFLTTLVGYTDIWYLISTMALATGALVGAAVRFAAGHVQGWAPGIIAVVIGLTSILVGKVGAFYVGDTLWAGAADYTVEDELAEATTDNAMMDQIAGRIHEEWVASGKITKAQLTEFENKLQQQFEEDYELGDYEEDYEEDYEAAPIDYEKNYLPEVWSAAKAEWDTNSPEEKTATKKEVEDVIRKEWGEFDEVVEESGLKLAMIEAVVSTFLSRGGLVFFCMGVFSSFKLGSNLGTDE